MLGLLALVIFHKPSTPLDFYRFETMHRQPNNYIGSISLHFLVNAIKLIHIYFICGVKCKGDRCV